MTASLADRLRPGDHVCWTYADDAERRRVTVACVRAGLRDHHRVLFVTGAQHRDAALADLTAGGIDAPTALRAGHLRVCTPGAPDTADLLVTAVRQALHDGYAGLRTVADLTWAADRLGSYERQLNRVCADGYGLAVCLYDTRACTAALLSRICRAHPATVSAHAPDAQPRLRLARRGATLTISGEADLSNRDALATLLHDLVDDAAPGRTVTLDLGDLRFADASTAELIITAAARAPGRLRAARPRPRVRRLLTLLGADRVPGLLSPLRS